MLETSTVSKSKLGFSMEDENWIYLKDQSPPKGAWCRLKGWFELTAKEKPGGHAGEWVEDEFAQQFGRPVMWRFAKADEVSDEAKRSDDD